MPRDQDSARRHAIVSAAFAVLMERGYAGASTLEIARRARVSKRELYAEFGSKSGILEALIAATAARMQVPLATAPIDDGDGLKAALVDYGIVALTELTAPPVIAINRLAAAEAGRSADLGRILDEQGRETNRKAMLVLFRKAQAGGLLGDGDTDLIAGQYFALLFGDLLLRLLIGAARPPTAREIRRRAEMASASVLALYPPRDRD